MKITILDKKSAADEDEIIVKCTKLDEDVVHLLNTMKCSGQCETGTGCVPPASAASGAPGLGSVTDDTASSFGAEGASDKLSLYDGAAIVLIESSSILYFESVDDRVFAYTRDQVLECKLKLYQLEALLTGDFLRANKAVIVNITKIEKLLPDFGGRIEATLCNNCQVIFSRMYVPSLKKRLGL